MGLIVKLEFENGVRTVEIDSEQNIEFLDYDINYDILAVSLGEKDNDTHEYRFCIRYEQEGPSALMDSHYLWDRYTPYQPRYHEDWTKAFVEAIEEQGIEAFGTGLSNADVARIIFDEYRNADDFMEFVNTFAAEDEIAEWLIGWLKEAIEDDGDSGTIAEILAHYINVGDAEIELEKDMYGGDDHSWENQEYTYVELTIRGEKIFKWSYMKKYIISNPVTFDGFVDEEDEDYYSRSDLDARERAEGAVHALGLQIPKIEDPEPPDHPESDENGDFAVLYIFGEDYSWDNKQDTWELAAYKTERNAKDAMELSEEIFMDQGDKTSRYGYGKDNVEMKLLRRLTPEELQEREITKRQVRLFDEPEAETEEWQEEWTLLEPPEETP